MLDSEIQTLSSKAYDGRGFPPTFGTYTITMSKFKIQFILKYDEVVAFYSNPFFLMNSNRFSISLFFEY